MSIDDQELRAIVFLATRVRRRASGAGPWDEPGLMANVRKLADRDLHMTIEHVLRHAADPAAKSPGVILGSFTPAAPVEKKLPVTPPRRAQECATHPGQYAANCGGCRADQLAGDEPPQRPDPTRVNASAAADKIRAELRARKAGDR